MKEWKECTIADLGEVVGGATPSTRKPENYENGDLAWITPKDLSTFNGRFIFRGERNITEIGLKSCSTRLLPPNTVLFSSRAPIGYVAIAAKEMCTNQGFKSVIPNADTDYMFLYYLLKYNRDSIENMGSGTTFKEVSGNTMKSIKVRVPVDKEEQRRIGAILSAIDDRIEQNTAINENLEQLVAAYYKELFGNCDYTANISDYADKVFSGGTPTTSNESYWNGEYNWLSSGETCQKFIVDTEKTITQEGIDNSSTRLASKYDTVIASAGQGHTRGQTSMLLTASYVNQSIITIHSEKVYAPFIYWSLCGRYEELRVISNSNSIRGSLTTKMISSFSVPKVDLSEISPFSDFAWAIIHEIEKNCYENIRLVALRDTLLPKLMNGEIDVSEVKI